MTETMKMQLRFSRVLLALYACIKHVYTQLYRYIKHDRNYENVTAIFKAFIGTICRSSLLTLDIHTPRALCTLNKDLTVLTKAAVTVTMMIVVIYFIHICAF